MPLWKISHPVGAYTAKDKADFAKAITGPYEKEMPAFYCDVFFYELSAENAFRGGESAQDFVRIEVDHLARSMPTRVMREFIMNMLTETIRPWLDGRGYGWEMTINELPADLWRIDGFTPPPFRSPAELRWRKDNRPSPYDSSETIALLEDGSIAGLAGGLNQ